MNPSELKSLISSGLLSFPVTDFDAAGDFEPKGYAGRLEWLMPYGATALFIAGGTGEFFSLVPKEYSRVVKTAADTCKGRVPIIAGAGGPTRSASWGLSFTAEACAASPRIRLRNWQIIVRTSSVSKMALVKSNSW